MRSRSVEPREFFNAGLSGAARYVIDQKEHTNGNLFESIQIGYLVLANLFSMLIPQSVSIHRRSLPQVRHRFRSRLS